MKPLLSAVIIGGLVAVVGWSACRSSPQPETLISEGERLRARYEKDASHQAIARFREAASISERTGHVINAARAWQRIGTTFGHLGLLEESLDAYRNALMRVERSSDRLLESDIRSDVGIAQAAAAPHRRALENARGECDRALALTDAEKVSREVARAKQCFGEVAYFGQDYPRALQFYQQASLLFDSLGDLQGGAQAQREQADVYSDLGQLARAQECLDRAEALLMRVGDRREQAITKIARGRLEVRRGNYQAALNHFHEASTWLHAMGDAVWEGSSLAGIAWVYGDMGESAVALKYFDRALQRYEAAGLKIYVVDILMSTGEFYLASGNDALALRHFERARALADEQGIDRWRAWALRFIGVVHLVRKEPARAREYFNQALGLVPHVGDPRLDRKLRADLGEAQYFLREHAAAINHYEQALALSRGSADRVTEAITLFGLARISSGTDELEKARSHIERALSVAESLRTAIDNRELRASYVASVYRYYEFYVGVLARLHQVRPNEGLAAKAFEASERARARSLLESLSDSGVDLRAGIDPDLLQREQAAKMAFDRWAERSRQLSEGAAGKAEAQRLASEYRDLEERFQEIQAEIRSRSPRYAALARPQPLSLREVQKEVLDRDTVLLEYALGEEQSYVWSVSYDTHTIHELPGRAQIEAAAQRVYDRLVARLALNGNEKDRDAAIKRADEEYWQEAARLSDMLIAPLAKRITGKRLLVVADGMLQYVPFAALPVPGSSAAPVPMLVEHEIVNLPSASVLAVLRRETAKRAQSPKTVAVLADPVFESDDPRLRARGRAVQQARADASSAPADTAAGARNPALRSAGFIREGRWNVPRLAATRQEADAIIAAAPAGMSLRKIDFDASRAAALGAELAQYQIVHFATHGVFDDENPGLSGLILSLYDERGQPQDGFLRLHDIYNMRLPAELIVLSACSTALGKQLKGEGLTGMVRGFLYAGAERVVASLWKVDDEATGELMRRFYAEMLQGRRSPAAALRQAQLEMWKQDRWQAPFYWAAFSLQGEWR